MSALVLLLLSLVGLAAFVAPWPVLVRLVKPGWYGAPGLDEWAAMWGWVVALAALAWLVMLRDRWLGAGIAWLALTPLLWTSWRAEILLVAIVALVVVSLPRMDPGPALMILSALGVAQALVVFVQYAGFDPLWNGWHRDPLQYVGGTFSHAGTAAAFLALTGVLAPWWALAVIGPALVATEIRAAIVALLVGLAIRAWPLPRVALIGVAVVMLLAVVVYSRAADPTQGLRFRLGIQGAALGTMITQAPVFGLGIGRWHEHKAVPVDQRLNGVDARLNPLHNDVVQWVTEAGLGGGILLALWLRSRWRSFVGSPVAPALAVAAVLLLTWYPLHHPATGAVLAVLLGLSPPSSLDRSLTP